MRDFLKNLHDNFSIFPVKKDKSPLTYWATYREKKIDFDQLLKHKHFAIVCGFDNLEVIDIDNHFQDADQMYQFLYDNLTQELCDKLPVIKTQGGGYHIYYKCEDIEGNKKLAQRINSSNRPETLIETRGAGGYVVSPPTSGYEVIKNDILNVPVISIEDRQMILTICRSLDEIEPKEASEHNLNVVDEKPGTKYINDPATVQKTIDLLKIHGWKSSNNKHFKRPGKDTPGISATFGIKGVNKFYCFSSNAYPFEPDTSYSMLGVLTMLEFNGDYSKAVGHLAKEYGMTQPKKETSSGSEKTDQKQKDKTSAKWVVLYKILKDWKLQFRFNELTKIIEYKKGSDDWCQLGLLLNDIVREMEYIRGISKIGTAKVLEMISSTDICEVYNPINTFFSNLPKWDGVDYFAEIMKYINLQHDENEVYFEAMFKKHLIRTVKCATDPNYTNRMVFIFYGPQEIGKSELIKWICPRELYDDEMIDTSSKDSLLKLARYLIVNMEELDNLQRKEVAKLKAYISKGDINTRVAYGRNDERFSRVASFFGSTNKNDILADESNTRWIILKVKSFNWQEYTVKINPLQLWAQAVELLKQDNNAGELSKEEKQEREQRNNQLFLETSAEREILIKYFEEGEDLLTATDIKLSIEKNLFPQKINLHQLVRELRRIYGDSDLKSVKGKVGRYYSLKNSLEQVPLPEGYTSYPVEKDLPF